MIRLTRADLMARAFPMVIAVGGVGAGVAGGVGLQVASPESAVGLLVSVATVNSAPVLIPLLGLCGRKLWHRRPRTATEALAGLLAAIGGLAIGLWATSAARAFRLGLAPTVGLGDVEILAGIGLIPTAAIGGWTIGGHAKRWHRVSGFGFGVGVIVAATLWTQFGLGHLSRSGLVIMLLLEFLGLLVSPSRSERPLEPSR